MIYFCADDYGLCTDVTERIQQCIDDGVLNKVSVFPNFDKVDFDSLFKNENMRLSLHLNLVEGKCMSGSEKTNMLTDSDGNFKSRFGGLFRNWLFHGKELEKQLYREIKAQVRYWKSILPPGVPFCIDSHQHTHMIPAVFNALLDVLKDENITPEYIRIPCEPILPYIKTPSLYFTYSPANIIKQWLLRFLCLINKRRAKQSDIPTALFMGVLFSGKMDKKRVLKILPHYEKISEKRGCDVEVLFHPGYTSSLPVDKNIVFDKFYLSDNRKTEFDSVTKIQKEVYSNALH